MIFISVKMSQQQPLLSSSGRPSSENSDDRALAEDELLREQLAGGGSGAAPRRRRHTPAQKYGWPFWREVGLFIWAMLATAAVIVIAVLYQHSQSSHHGEPERNTTRPPSGKRNLIFMVSDGMGPTSLSLTRSVRQFESGLPADEILILDKHLIGSSRTRSSSSYITDSAAGATAFSCGMKSYNGAISVLPDHSPCGTILEAAKRAGYLTGLVVTTRITDATPACFAAHVNMRNEEDRIAEQEVGDYPLGRVVDLILGGGRCHFLPQGTDGSCRADDKDVVASAKKNGFSYIDSREGFDSLKQGAAVTLPLLGLLASYDIPYEIDRRFVNTTYPSLDEMARTALTALSEATKDTEQGFFLMIEGSRIDHAGHANDPHTQVHEVLAYDKAFATALKFLEDSDVPGVVVSTSDHETGGLATARQLHTSYPEYLWYPGVLANGTHSSENLSKQLNAYRSSTPTATPSSTKEFVLSLVLKGLGITDATDDEIKLIVDNPDASGYFFADMISRRAQIGWSTHGHSAVDVNIYASDNADARLALGGNHENTEVGDFMRKYLELDLESVTKELREKGVGSWMGSRPVEGEWVGKVDSYHGDFRHRH
ncbi:MAG: hypothetical protein M1829_003448 [Trizodia sp. TS-e1964]|nr:MAG: hypothetical protein M1829_003448 [Trizodia sp. TS-e1964]